ncbi:hypothetical protein [Cryptosporangium arvum]|uniref:hypothetical protein n=1 Tax=Cryptosporangium arvum TaxID=80871 RepID=UPI00055F7F8F|nr:hypothetical protein [Cryptosporangium arvum]
MTASTHDPGWVPSACTLPPPEQPQRVAEFDALFAAALRRVERPAPTRLRLVLRDAAGRRAAVEDLAARETSCCAFVTFTLAGADGELLLDAEVPAAQTDVLDALAARATAAAS